MSSDMILNNALENIGTVHCIDCDGRHSIMKDARGILVSAERCPGKGQKTATESQQTEMAETVCHVEGCLTELKTRFDEGDWEQVQAVSEEMSIKLNSIGLMVGAINKS